MVLREGVAGFGVRSGAMVRETAREVKCGVGAAAAGRVGSRKPWVA